MQPQWSMRFEGEEVKVVALGASWVAAITSRNFLRIFSEGGLQVISSSLYFDSAMSEAAIYFDVLHILFSEVIF